MRLQVNWILLKLTAVITYFVLSHFPFTDDPRLKTAGSKEPQDCVPGRMEPYNINTVGLSVLLEFCVRFKVTQTGPNWGMPSKAVTLFDTKTWKFQVGTGD